VDATRELSGEVPDVGLIRAICDRTDTMCIAMLGGDRRCINSVSLPDRNRSAGWAIGPPQVGEPLAADVCVVVSMVDGRNPEVPPSERC